MQQQFKEVQTLPILGSRNSEIAVSEAVVGPEQQKVGELLLALKHAKPKWRKRCGIMVSGILSGLLVPMTTTLTAHGFHFWIAAPIALSVSIGLGGVIEWAFTARGRKLAKQLAQYDDKRAVGPLLEALAYDDTSTGPPARTALMRLLPQLHASDSRLLTVEHRAILNGLLDASAKRLIPAQFPLLLTVLQAFKQIGDARAIPEVRKLANGEGTGKDATVRKAAIDCLPFLERTVRQAEEQTTLLRASEAAVSAEGLLLPAAPGPDKHAEQLLRAQGADTND